MDDLQPIPKAPEAMDAVHRLNGGGSTGESI
jgi:hypothetical protein